MQPVPSPTSPDTGVSVRFPTAVLENIRSAADAGLKSLPRRGAEIGGLLITSSPDDPPDSIDEVALIPSEYRYGPSYHLSPRDLALLRATAASNRKGRRVAGFFRTCTAEAFAPSPNDLDVLREQLPGCRVLLIVKPYPDGHALARVFQLRNGNWDQTAEFPIVAEKQAPRPVRVRTAPKPTLILQTAQFPAPARKTRKLPSVWIYSLLGCLVLVIAIAFLGPRTPEATGLGLNVTPEGDLLRVTWNRNSPAIRSGKGGLLRIDEGGQHQDIALNPGQLASGSVLYRSQARDITFRLAVNGTAQGDESIRFVSGAAPATATATATPVPVSTAPAPVVVPPRAKQPEIRTAAKPEPPREETTTARVTNTSAPVVPPRVKPPETRPAANKAEPAREERDVAVTRPAPQTQDTVDRAAPQVITPAKTQPIQQAAKPPEQSPPAPAGSQPVQTTQTPPRQPAAEEKPWEPIKSVMHYFEDPAVTRPTPVKEVQPKMKSVPEHPLQVRVLVAVDARGGVTGAESLERSGDPELVSEALAAARKWRFEPARDHGKKVAATYTITFRFPSDNP